MDTIFFPCQRSKSERDTVGPYNLFLPNPWGFPLPHRSSLGHFHHLMGFTFLLTCIDPSPDGGGFPPQRFPQKSGKPLANGYPLRCTCHPNHRPRGASSSLVFLRARNKCWEYTIRTTVPPFSKVWLNFHHPRVFGY
ncbi:hypothetical protein TNIN_498341 [Trichonephila inaurata madagascariensis]|uniref:Uncharacterized protein n=1 Tax=Trichonephila inaurata madagascariensis TaxID=2747483 RepID=A0A8X6YQY5_9ARAC|nr:hypothetical protein TNIN_498341 [Trichonephila inaurata madagascariensis]